MLDQSTLLVILAAGLGTAILVFALLAAFSTLSRTTPGKANRFLENLWMRFEGEICTGASPSALEIIGVSSLANLDWRKTREALTPRFADLPAALQATAEGEKVERFLARFPDDRAKIELDYSSAHVTLSLVEDAPATPADRHLNFVQRGNIAMREDAVNKLIHPTWATRNGEIFWTNQAFRTLQKARKKAFGEDAEVFEFDLHKSLGGEQARTSLTIGFAQDEVHWFDITSVEFGSGSFLHCAVNVNGLITAETTQRKFVQTLAKTFAQLSTGLAIFDRNRRLVLFNPALVDLTSLPAHFLSGQPNLQNFFDRLRDNRIMPEPKDYSSWRRQIADLVVQSSNGRYQETWRLPNGLTYRIAGRPHPDGAIAILIEDISVEMSLTQRFKGQVELRENALHALGDAVVCFEQDGSISLWNEAFTDFLGLPRGTPASSHSLASVVQLWKNKLAPGAVRNTLSARLRNAGEQQGRFTLTDGAELPYELRVHDGNATIISLRTSTLDAPAEPVEASKLSTL